MEFITEKNRVYYAENGKTLAEITFPSVKDNVVEINHTFVDESLRGQGVAGKLIEAAYQEIKNSGRKAVPSCSYAVSWFEKNADKQDILLSQN